MAEEKWYRLTQGKHHHREVGDNGEEKMVLTAGDEVMLTDEQYENMKDRFEPIPKGKSKAEGYKDEPVLSPTQPQRDGTDSDPPADAKVPAGTDTTSDDKAANKATETKPQGTATGAGAAANSTNSQKIK